MPAHSKGNLLSQQSLILVKCQDKSHFLYESRLPEVPNSREIVVSRQQKAPPCTGQGGAFK